MLYVLGALFIGLSLGLLGSGGSIFTVPILHYGLGWEEKAAVAGSLFVVGTVSLAGMLPQARAGRVRWRSVGLFGVPGVVGTWGGAFVSRWVPGPAQLALFAGVMLLAAWFMRRPIERAAGSAPRAAWKVVADGLGVGVLTGLVGVGGGFLIVPALVLLGGLPMHTAVGTSLAIIAAKSFAGFLEYRAVLSELGVALDWNALAIFAALGTVGSLTGGRLGSRVPQDLLKTVFSAVLVVLAIAILAVELGGSGGTHESTEEPVQDRAAPATIVEKAEQPTAPGVP